MNPDSPQLIACPVCDLLHTVAPVPLGGRLRCRRCHTVLLTNRPGTIDRTLAGAFGSLILLVAALWFPFLELSAAGFNSRASLLDATRVFSHGIMVPLSVAVALLVIVLPTVRAGALTYALLPLRLGRPPAHGARTAFRLASRLRPWAMAEVFLIGVVVALVKIGGMATVTLGPAFWALAGLVIIVVYEGASLCEWSVWQTLDESRAP